MLSVFPKRVSRSARLGLASLAFGAMAATASAADLTVSLRQVNETPGTLHVVVFSESTEDDFGDPAKALVRDRVPAAPGQVSLRFDLPPGRYAAMAFHDEDGDEEMDRFLGMWPTEGYALSNDPDVSGPPPFDDSAFTLGPEGAQIDMSLRY